MSELSEIVEENKLAKSGNLLFSVLIANYNNGLYLEECLRSIFAQTYTNWEIVIVDDASTDNSSNIYEKFIED
jgi:glycosyltransferase involved in cell wall biosynthesis